jgi:hypothetical protein
MCVKNINKLRKNYSVTFLKKWELDEIALWKHTQDIDEDVMQYVYRKKVRLEGAEARRFGTPRLRAFVDTVAPARTLMHPSL